MSETVELSVLDSLTIADALVDVAMGCNSDRRERIIHALHALGYPDTAHALETLASHSVKV